MPLTAGRHRTLNIQMRIEAAEQQVEVSGDNVASTDPASNGDQIVLRQIRYRRAADELDAAFASSCRG